MSTIPPRRPRAEELHKARWRKSSYSGGANDCVEIADLGVYVAVRDSKDLGRSPVILGRSALDICWAIAPTAKLASAEALSELHVHHVNRQLGVIA